MEVFVQTHTALLIWGGFLTMVAIATVVSFFGYRRTPKHLLQDDDDTQ